MCVQRCSSAYHCCNVWLFALLSPSCQLWPVCPFSSDLSHWARRFCPQNCCSLDVFCFSHHSLQTLETVVRENPRRSAVSEILKPPCLAPTIIPRSKSLRSHFFPILTFGLKNSWTSWPRLHAFMHLVCCHMIGWLNICINKLGIPAAVYWGPSRSSSTDTWTSPSWSSATSTKQQSVRSHTSALRTHTWAAGAIASQPSAALQPSHISHSRVRRPGCIDDKSGDTDALVGTGTFYMQPTHINELNL